MVSVIKAVKKPVQIEAMEYTGYNYDDLVAWARSESGDSKVAVVFTTKGTPTLYVDTLEGAMQVKRGNMVIKGIKGELYSCDREIFDMTYTVLED